MMFWKPFFGRSLSVMALAISSLSLCLPANATRAQDKDDKKVDAQKLFSDGQQALQDKKFEEAAKAFEAVLKEVPDQPFAWHLLGFSYHSQGDYDKALKAHEKAASFDETKTEATYNIACVYSLKKEQDKAFEYLHKAITAGFRDMTYFETDTDLDNLRKDPRFKKILARVKNKGAEPLEIEELVGDWTFKKGTRASEEVAAERLQGSAKFDKEKVTIPAGPGSSFVMRYKINKESKIPQIDLEIESGPVNEGKALGLIKFEEGMLHLCYDPKGEERPAKFQSTKENGCFYFVLEKVEK